MVPLTLGDTLRLSTSDNVKSIKLASASEQNATGTAIGILPQQFSSRGDSIAAPFIKVGLYKKLSKPLLKQIEDTLQQNLSVEFSGFVQFTRDLTSQEVQQFMPKARVISGNIGTFHGVSLRELMTLSNHKDISHFEKSRRLFPNPAMGVGN